MLPISPNLSFTGGSATSSAKGEFQTDQSTSASRQDAGIWVNFATGQSTLSASKDDANGWLVFGVLALVGVVLWKGLR